MSITVAILALDEERMISRAVASASWADEVLVIDGGSRDATVSICELAGARVVGRPFDDFARQRNFALEQATGDWVLFVDADERVTPELAAEVRALLGGAPDADAYAVPRRSMALGHWLNWHPGGRPDAPVRLLRRGGARWSGAVHETVEGAARIGALRAPLIHLTHRSVSEVVQKIDRYTTLEADARVAAGAEAPGARAMLDALPKALKSLWKSGLKDEGDVGAAEAVLLAFNEALALLKVWERAQEIPEAYRRVDEAFADPPPAT